MRTKRLGWRQTELRTGRRSAALWFLLLSFPHSARPQDATTLSRVKKVYVEPFGQESGVERLRDRTIQQLQSKAKLQVVAAPEQADAIVRGTGSIWPAGYVSTDPRSPSTTRQRVFQGFLSMEVIGKDHEPLWSYLVTPGELRIGDITNELADRLVEKFVQARKQSAEAPAGGISGAAPTVALTVAGATFPAPLYQKWFELFHERNPNATINYKAVGSDAGVELLMRGEVDFAASDVPLSREKIAASKRAFLQVATATGAVVPAYNLKAIGRSVNFTPEVLAGIYQGRIKRWNDPAIRASNRDADLPDQEIAVIHRSDGSGTTFAWTDFLSKVSTGWRAAVGVGTVVHWPVGTGAEGNEGVATAIQQTANSIGYVELAYALQHQLSFGAVRNAAGKFIEADLPSVTAAAEAAGNLGLDSQASIIDAQGKNAYPIATLTWWVVPEDIAGKKRAAVRELLEWMLSSGQKECSALAYAPLPREVVNRELQVIDGLK